MTKIFVPDDRDLRDRYPELRAVKQFKELTKMEMLFVYYYACKSSPCADLSPSGRILKAIELSDMTLDDSEYDRMVEGKFSDRLKPAIRVMEEFKPEVRSQAKAITDRILENLYKASLKSVDTCIDMGEVKQIIDCQINIAKNLPDIVLASEHGYGVDDSNTVTLSDEKMWEKSWESKEK